MEFNLFGLWCLLCPSLYITVLVVKVSGSIEVEDVSQLITISNKDKFVASKPRSLTLSAGFSVASHKIRHEKSKLLREEILEPSLQSTVKPENPSSDSCDGKKDGYYPNYESGCSSYYYCAAGYQITYLCSPDEYFDGSQCSSDYECPAPLTGSLCKSKPNGYYASDLSSSNYYYCYYGTKVMDLKCDDGKVFIHGECSSEKSLGAESKESQLSMEVTCSNRKNGFYQNFKDQCTTYYYCIEEKLTMLHCDADMVFDGDLCVQKTMYNCPTRKAKNGSLSTKKLNNIAHKDKTSSILSRKLSSHHENHLGNNFHPKGDNIESLTLINNHDFHVHTSNSISNTVEHGKDEGYVNPTGSSRDLNFMLYNDSTITSLI